MILAVVLSMSLPAASAPAASAPGGHQFEAGTACWLRIVPCSAASVASAASAASTATAASTAPAASTQDTNAQVAQNAQAMDALFEEAWRESPAVMRAEADVEDASASLAGARVWLPNPEIESAVLTDAPFGNEGDLDFDVGLVQELSWPGGTLARIAAGESSVSAARARRAAVRLEVAAAVETAVADVVAARESQRTRAELVRVARAMSEAARRKHEAGSIGALEAALVSADAASAEASMLFAQAQVSEAESALCRALAREACEPFELRWPDLVAVDVEGERLDVRAAAAEREAAQRRTDAAGIAWLPTVRVGAGYGFERAILHAVELNTDVTDEGHLLAAKVSITLPVWDWRRQDVLAARAATMRAEADAREAALRAKTDVPAARAALQAANAAVERLAAVQDDVTRALADIERAYDAGAMALDAALTSRDRLLKARLDGIDAQRRRVAAHAQVLRALSLPLLPGIDTAEAR